MINLSLENSCAFVFKTGYVLMQLEKTMVKIKSMMSDITASGILFQFSCKFCRIFCWSVFVVCLGHSRSISFHM